MTKLSTSIWREVPQKDNPYSADKAFLHGYDMYGQMLGNASYIQTLFLLLTGQRPTDEQERLLENLSVALINPGVRDQSVHAAMASAVGGSQAAATLMAALSVGAGQNGGSRDVFMAMVNFALCGSDMDAWHKQITQPALEKDDVWPVMEHTPGFAPYGETTPLPVQQTLQLLADDSQGALTWLLANQATLENIVGHPISFAGVAAAAYTDLGLSPVQGEMLHLLLRLPGAAAHGLEQGEKGFKAFPFPSIDLTDDPAKS
jgi:citrate synthase